MALDSCPIITTIHEIRGAGIYADDQEESTDRLIKVIRADTRGASSAQQIEYVMADVSFYMMSRKLELARFEVSNPTLTACKLKHKKMFSSIIGLTNAELCTYIIDKALNKKYLYTQFTRLVDLIGDIEGLIIDQVDALGRDGRQINVSLPNITFLPHIDQLIIYNPTALEQTTNKIIDYINKLNVNSILAAPIVTKLRPVPPFRPTVPLDSISQWADDLAPTDTVSGYLLDMKKMMSREMLVATYVNEIEKYHCDVINHMTAIYLTCKLLVDGLVSRA